MVKKLNSDIRMPDSFASVLSTTPWPAVYYDQIVRKIMGFHYRKIDILEN
jgi:hypothetical protein